MVGGRGRFGAAPVASAAISPATSPPCVRPTDTIAVLRTSTGTGGDVFALSMSEPGRRARWCRPPATMAAPLLTDGRWLLYASNGFRSFTGVSVAPYPAMDRNGRSRRPEARSLAGATMGVKCSTVRGTRMLVVEVTTRGGEVKLSEPRLLFSIREFASGGYITIAYLRRAGRRASS